jgi:hypothetical protein
MAIKYLMWHPKFNIGLNLIIEKSMDHMLENKSEEDVYLNIPKIYCISPVYYTVGFSHYNMHNN